MWDGMECRLEHVRHYGWDGIWNGVRWDMGWDTIWGGLWVDWNMGCEGRWD